MSKSIKYKTIRLIAAAISGVSSFSSFKRKIDIAKKEVKVAIDKCSESLSKKNKKTVRQLNIKN